jgi:hypothetical protein
MDPALIYGPVGALVCLVFAVAWLNTERKVERKRGDDLQAKLDIANVEIRELAKEAIVAMRQIGRPS